MIWGQYWRELILSVVVLASGFRWFHATDAVNPITTSSTWTPERKLALREKTRDLWYHGFDNYMSYAFPLDELAPLSCTGRDPDWADPANIASNDVAGNYSLTLVDVLDSFIVLDDRPGFERAVRHVIEWVTFDVDTKPQVFESTIRVLGGLLSAHIFANRTGQPFHLPWYRGELLSLAHDLGKRLLPAFSTPTGLPYARINLRRGLVKGETTETCTAGAGSLILEFATLSRLTGDDRFEKAAYKAFFGIWNRKSNIGLVGNTIDTMTGRWMFPETTGIGAGMDSFYEYALKWYIMSGELEFLDVWDDAYDAIMRYVRSQDGYWYRTVNIYSGDVAYHTIDSLSAFWPGLQVLSGDVQSAIKLHMIYYNLWKQHSGLPEVYDTAFQQATSHQYPLRPEFIESTWYLYRATRDSFYLDVGERILFDLTTRAKVNCGLAGIQDLRTNKLDDRMESFALSETLKYLYLLFDEENPLHNDDSNYVFTTEGHILSLDSDHLRPIPPARKRMRTIDQHQCPAYTPFKLSLDPQTGSGLNVGVRSRPDVEYSRKLIGLTPSRTDERHWFKEGWCERPNVKLYSFEFILAPDGKLVPEDLSPSYVKLALHQDGFIINNATGIRTLIVQRLDGKGYDIRRLGHYSVRPGHIVYVNDSSLFGTVGDEAGLYQRDLHRETQVQLRIFFTDTELARESISSNSILDMSMIGYTALFGADLSSSHMLNVSLPIVQPEGLQIRREDLNKHGCVPFEHSYPNSALIVHRGQCSFLAKLMYARAASASAIIVISDKNLATNPAADADELEVAGDLSDSAVILVPKKSGELLEDIFSVASKLGTEIRISVDPKRMEERGGDTEQSQPVEKDKEAPRILYVNGHPLINARLLV